jgi:excisionase family DNA binding protein
MTTKEFDGAALLTLGQIASITGIDRRTLDRALRAGGINVLRIGRWRRVERLAIKTAMPAFYEAMVRKLEDVRS